jgi:hypothetical protein
MLVALIFQAGVFKLGFSTWIGANWMRLGTLFSQPF